jgi:hypothetical protein
MTRPAEDDVVGVRVPFSPAPSLRDGSCAYNHPAFIVAADDIERVQRMLRSQSSPRFEAAAELTH